MEKKTCELIEELSKREGIQELNVDPYNNLEVLINHKKQVLENVQGPMKILIVWD